MPELSREAGDLVVKVANDSDYYLAHTKYHLSYLYSCNVIIGKVQVYTEVQIAALTFLIIIQSFWKPAQNHYL